MRLTRLYILTITLFFSAHLLAIGGPCGANIHWTLNEKTGELALYGNGAMFDYQANRPALWADCRDKIKTITFSGAITRLGNYAFYGCSNLKAVELPKSVVAIGDSCFANCTSLNKFTAKGAIESYGEGTFANTAVLPPAPVAKSTAAKPAAQPAAAKPDKAKPAAAPLAAYPTKGECGPDMHWSLNVKSGKLTIFGNGEMYNYSPTGLAPWANYCDIIKSVSFSGKITGLGDYAFYNCRNLKEVKLPKQIEMINYYCFANCTSLNKIKFSYNTTRFAAGSLANTAFSSWFVSSSAECGSGFIHSAHNLWSITVSNSSSRYVSADNVMYTKNMERLFLYPAGHTRTSFTIPSDVKEIGKWSFAGSRNLTEIIIPEGVTEIAEFAFEDCANLQTIAIPTTVTKIGEGAFRNCTGLKTIEMSGDLKEIGPMAFYGCTSLQRLEIPGKVLKLGKNAVGNCDSLQYISFPNGMEYETANIRPEAEIDVYHSIHIRAKKNFIKRKDALPPSLTLVPNSIRFVDATGNSQLDAYERGMMCFQIKNEGQGSAYDCMARASLSGDTAGVTATNTLLPDIKPGETVEVGVPVLSGKNTVDGEVACTVEVFDPQGFGIAPFTGMITTRKFVNPMLSVTDFKTDSKDNVIAKRKPFQLTITVENTQKGKAQDVNVELKLPYGVMVWEGERKHHFDIINGEEKKIITYSLIASALTSSSIELYVDLSESEGMYATGKKVILQVK